MELFDLITEAKKDKKTKAQKSRVKVYDTIKDALNKSYMGQVFSTKKAGRLYVTTHKKWGKDKASQVGGKVAKGFTPGSATPGASWPEIKGYAVRTMARHGGQKTKKFTGGKYWKSKKKGKKHAAK